MSDPIHMSIAEEFCELLRQRHPDRNWTCEGALAEDLHLMVDADGEQVLSFSTDGVYIYVDGGIEVDYADPALEQKLLTGADRVLAGGGKAFMIQSLTRSIERSRANKRSFEKVAIENGWLDPNDPHIGEDDDHVEFLKEQLAALLGEAD